MPIFLERSVRRVRDFVQRTPQRQIFLLFICTFIIISIDIDVQKRFAQIWFGEKHRHLLSRSVWLRLKLHRYLDWLAVRGDIALDRAYSRAGGAHGLSHLHYPRNLNKFIKL